MTNEVDLIVRRARKLSAMETLTLIQKLTADVRLKLQTQAESKDETTVRRGVYFGKYANHPGPETTEEDFKAAEYRFDESEWQ